MSVANKDIWPVLKDLFLEQYKGDLRAEIEAQGCTLPEGADNRLQGLLKAVVDKLMQPLDDACVELQELLDIDTATGARLDLIGKLSNLKREAGESDAMYKERVIGAFFSDNEGTPDFAVMMAAMLSGDQYPQFMDESPATFIIYDGPVYEHRGENDDMLIKEPGVKQLTHAQVRKLAPTGVLGLPGAALNVADPNEDPLLLVLDPEDEWGGKLLAFVADDSTVENELVLADNTGNVIMASHGAPVSVTIKGNVSVPTIPASVGGTTYDTVRIKDLPDVNGGFLVRDSEEGGTGKAHSMTENELDALWEDTPAEEEDNG